jgi:hypothetical protein
MSTNNEKNYEKLYNDLQQEFATTKQENDELISEYESTIQMLSDSIETLKQEKEELTIKLNNQIKNQNSLVKELDSLKVKNLDKLKDIELLNKKNEILEDQMNKMNQSKNVVTNKIVGLENDNDHYLNKIREYESYLEDLQLKLENALEENISLQTDYETYKQKTEDELIRKDEILKEYKNEIMNKDKIIDRFGRRDSFNIQKLKNHLISENLKNLYDLNNKNSNKNLNNAILSRTYSSESLLNKMNKFKHNNSLNNNLNIKNTNSEILFSYRKNSINTPRMIKESVKEEKDKEENCEENSIIEENNNLKNQKVFDRLEITSYEVNFLSINNNDNNNNKSNGSNVKNNGRDLNLEMKENLKKMLQKVQQKKALLNKHKKVFNENMDKMGLYMLKF